MNQDTHVVVPNITTNVLLLIWL